MYFILYYIRNHILSDCLTVGDFKFDHLIWLMIRYHYCNGTLYPS